MDLLSPNFGLMFWTSITFLLLYVILYRFAWGPLRAALDERERKIKESLDKAELAQAKADESLKKQEEIIRQAREEAQALIEKGKRTAEALREEIVSKARQEADTLLQRAKSEITLERQKAVDEIRRLAVELSIAATTKAIGKALTREDHEALILQSMQELGEMN